MDFALCVSAFFAFLAGHPASALLLRCGLEACQRFSPRAALDLSAVSALAGALSGLACRGGPRSVPGSQRGVCIAAALVGGCVGRALLLMFTARFPGTLLLTRVQMLPLLILALIALYPASRVRLSLTPIRLALLTLLSSLADGFFGAGGMALFALTALGGVQRKRDTPACALLMTCVSQTGALLLTHLTGEAQAFPVRMIALLAAGSAAGALASEQQKERGALLIGIRIALMVYLVLSAASCIEQGLTAG